MCHQVWPGCSAAVATVLIIFTLAINVPIHKQTRSWDADHPRGNWQQERTRWHTYQGVPAVLLAVWFLCAAAAAALG